MVRRPAPAAFGSSPKTIVTMSGHELWMGNGFLARGLAGLSPTVSGSFAGVAPDALAAGSGGSGVRPGVAGSLFPHAASGTRRTVARRAAATALEDCLIGKSVHDGRYPQRRGRAACQVMKPRRFMDRRFRRGAASRHPGPAHTARVSKHPRRSPPARTLPPTCHEASFLRPERRQVHCGLHDSCLVRPRMRDVLGCHEVGRTALHQRRHELLRRLLALGAPLRRRWQPAPLRGALGVSLRAEGATGASAGDEACARTRTRQVGRAAATS
jgi:hypothetical protein